MNIDQIAAKAEKELWLEDCGDLEPAQRDHNREIIKSGIEKAYDEGWNLGRTPTLQRGAC
jgi:hypothetical protein